MVSARHRSAGPLSVAGLRSDVPMRLLAGIGLFGLADRQLAPGLRASWRRGRLQLHDAPPAGAIERFLLFDYRPSPILAPWNAGGGFTGRDGARTLDAFERSRAGRFEAVRVGIAEARALIDPQTSPLKLPPTQKAALLARLADGWTGGDWVRAVCRRRDRGLPSYAPLLGTGGNDGRLDFSQGFIRRLAGLLDLESAAGLPRAGAADRLRAALWDDVRPNTLDREPVGLLHPAAAGGANVGNGPIGRPSGLAWLFVLAHEGLLILARLWGDLERPGFDRVASSSAVEPARYGLRCPIWSQPLDFAQASTLIEASRESVVAAETVSFGVAKRNGRSSLTVPSIAPGRVSAVTRRLHAWRELRPSSTEAPQTLRAALLRADVFIDELDRRGTPAAARRLLEALADLERLTSCFPRSALRAGLLAVPLLPTALVELADDQDPDFRAARVLAEAEVTAGAPLREHLVGVEEGRSDPAGLRRRSRGRDAIQVGPRLIRAPGGSYFRRLLSRRVTTTGRRGLLTRGWPLIPAVLHAARPEAVLRVLPALLAAEAPGLEPVSSASRHPCDVPAWFACVHLALHDPARRGRIVTGLAAGDAIRALRASGWRHGRQDLAVDPERLALALLLAGDPPETSEPVAIRRRRALPGTGPSGSPDRLGCRRREVAADFQSPAGPVEAGEAPSTP